MESIKSIYNCWSLGNFNADSYSYSCNSFISTKHKASNFVNWKLSYNLKCCELFVVALRIVARLLWYIYIYVYIWYIWYDIYDILYDIWYVICGMWYVIWYVIYDIWYIWYDIMWYIWYMVYDMIYDIWYDTIYDIIRY